MSPKDEFEKESASSIRFGYIERDVKSIKVDIKEMNNSLKTFCSKMEKTFVTQKEFKPVKNIVYGAVGTMLTLILTTIVLSILVG